MRVVTFLLLVVLFALGTFLAGWWAVPALALVWGLAAGRLARRPAASAALAAMVAWAALLVFDAGGGRLGALGDLFGAIAKLPAPVFFALTLAFPALLAWSAAALGASVWPRRAKRRHYVPASRVLDEPAGPATRPGGRAAARG
ncbi:MAG: hypothetical protein JO180_00470 [Gemmatirosa sp.]|nr:hypothetical protein [Gemmatirosa sp.]